MNNKTTSDFQINLINLTLKSYDYYISIELIIGKHSKYFPNEEKDMNYLTFFEIVYRHSMWGWRMNHGVLMNKNTLTVVVSNGIVKVTTGATITAITEVESSLDDSSLHSHDEEKIVSKEEDSNEEYFESKDEVAKEL